MNRDEIKKIAGLARLEISEQESEKMATQIDSVLDYVNQIKEANIDDDGSRIENAGTRNIMRGDDEHHQTNNHTEDLLAEAPETEDDLIKVKKIL